jgi:hypothetical protein
LKKSRFRAGVFQEEEDKENFPKEKSQENRNKKSFHEETDKENFSQEKSRSLVPAGNMMTSSSSIIGPRSGLISSSEIAKQTPTKLLKRTNIVATVMNKPLRVILKPALTKRRINQKQRIQLLSFYFK